MMLMHIALSVLCSTLLFVLFKLFERYKLSTARAIVVNYLVAALFGSMLLPRSVDLFLVYQKPWFWLSALMGFLFISLFHLMAYIAQNIGLSVASVASKMSVVVPVSAAIVLFGDAVTFQKIAGILLALAGIWMASMKERKGKAPIRLLVFPVILFLGSGMLDTLLKYAEGRVVPREDQLYFIPSIFLMAFLWGLLITPFISGKKKIAGTSLTRSIAGGVLLGVVNYGSIYFIWKALASDGAESSVVFPLANMGVVAASSLAGLMAFGEVLSKRNWFGIGISILAIIIMTSW